MLGQAETHDAAKDERSGSDRSGDELPEELRHTASRLKRIRQAMAALEQRAPGEAVP